MAFINQKRKVTNKESDSLCIKLRCYQVLGIQSNFENLMANPLLNITIPILIKELELESNDDLGEIVDKSIMLSYCDFDRIGILFKKSYRHFWKVYNYDTYKMNVITDFVALLRRYNKHTDTSLYYKKETAVFDEVDLNKIKFECIVPDDSIYIAQLYNLDLLDGNAKELVFEFAKYLNENSQITYKMIYDEFTKYHLYALFKSEKKLNYISLVHVAISIQNSLLFCFLIAYVKWKNLFMIDNNSLIKYLDPIYINVFRRFWWKCEMWSKYQNVINENVTTEFYEEVADIDYLLSRKKEIEYWTKSYVDFERILVLGSEFVYKLKRFAELSFLMGIDITIDDEYLNVLGEPNKVWAWDNFGKNMAINLYGLVLSKDDSGHFYVFPSFKIEDQEDCQDSIINKSGKMVNMLHSYLSDIVPKEKQEYVLNIIQEKANEKERTKSIRVIRAAYEVGLFNNLPSYNSLIDYGFNTLGSKSLYSKKIKDDLLLGKGVTKEVDLYHVELMNYFLKITNKLCSLKDLDD